MMLETPCYQVRPVCSTTHDFLTIQDALWRDIDGLNIDSEKTKGVNIRPKPVNMSFLLS